MIPRNTQDPNQRKLLNVVEEMAIASGTPAPPVYLLANEPGINAFAAGFSPRDAVIGVTQGAIEHLSRDQLQGVIAHEFSHIFNGNMRLNIRLMGALNGILILGILGYYLLYSTALSGRRRSNDKSGAIIGARRRVDGHRICRHVFRWPDKGLGKLTGSGNTWPMPRQFNLRATRTALQGALKRIGSLESGSKIENPGAPELSHAFFAQGNFGFHGNAIRHAPAAGKAHSAYRSRLGWQV